jgi:L,D-peptidoglycan transpeptidase YkuD (ErfK/YbiS/YcfS/YnhG family)
MQIIIKNKDTLLLDEFKFKCSVGKNGTTFNKIEGDLKTPKGTYSIGSLFYRKDKVVRFSTKLKKIPIKKNMYWCNDINSKYYNKLITSPKKGKHEKMFRGDGKYDLIIIINYNTKKIIKRKGSAIFLHLTSDYKKTEGCVAIKKTDMLVLLKLINNKTKININ